MMSSASVAAGTRRQSVSDDRVFCWRLGPGELERCRECVYLLRLEGATEGGSAATHVVCADDDRDGVFVAW